MRRRNEGEAQPKGKQFPGLVYDMSDDEYLPCGKVAHSSSISNMKASEGEFEPMRCRRLNQRNRERQEN